MSHIFQAGSDFLTTAQALAAYWTALGTSQLTAAALRTGTQGFWIGATAGRKQVPAAFEHATFIFGFSVERISSTAPTYIFFSSDANATTHVVVRLEADTSITVRRGSITGTTIASAAIGAAPLPRNYYEVKVTLHDTTGSIEIRRNGAVVLTATGLDTKNAGTKTVFDTILLQAGGSGQEIYSDDIYLANGAGTVNNDFYGDTEIVARYPTGAGAVTQFTPSTGANWAAVDDATPVTTDYVTGQTDGHRDLYNFQDLTNTSGIIRAVTVHAYAAKVGTDAKYIRFVCRIAGVDYESTSYVLSTTATHYFHTWETDPSTGVAWANAAAINNAEFGVVAKDS